MAISQTLPMVVRADSVPGCKQGHWTYASYAAIPDDGKRYEVVDGVLYMAPAPGMRHQGSSALFTAHLVTHVQFAGFGRVFSAPCDLELASRTVMQPDIIVVLNDNLSIITETRIIGAPDLVSEIASPGTAGYDRRTKQDAYTHAGDREYWIADPYARTIEVLELTDDGYLSAGIFEGEAMLPSRVLPELPVPVSQFFA
jgi:Uma2 family endonuclease